MKISWASEKTSISTVDMLETVEAETEVKNTSRFRGLNDGRVLGFETFKAKKPKNERNMKYPTSIQIGFTLKKDEKRP